MSREIDLSQCIKCLLKRNHIWHDNGTWNEEGDIDALVGQPPLQLSIYHFLEEQEKNNDD